MFDLNEIPTFIEKKKHGKRYNIDLATKREIRMLRFSEKKTKIFIQKKYKLPLLTINKILQESE